VGAGKEGERRGEMGIRSKSGGVKWRELEGKKKKKKKKKKDPKNEKKSGVTEKCRSVEVYGVKV
jgi:hypothetical protein